MLTNGFDHVAVLTNDTERFLAFYKDMFDAEAFGLEAGPGMNLTMVKIGHEASRRKPMF